jgi:hypothetical protein
MAITLRDGIQIDDIQWTPVTRATSDVVLRPSKDPKRKGTIFMPTGMVGPDTSTIISAAFEVDGGITFGKAKNFSSAELQSCDIRFLQFIFVDRKYFHYAGRKPSDGYVEIEASGPLTQRWLLDRRSSDNPAGDSWHPYYWKTQTDKSYQNWKLSLDDTPFSSGDLDQLNTKTNKWNFLFRAGVEAEFFSCLVFVHVNQTPEPLMGVRWKIRHQWAIDWLRGVPMTDHTINSNTIVDSKEIMKESDPVFQLFRNGRTDIVNVIGNPPDWKSSSSYRVTEFPQYGPAMVRPGFWK